MLEMSESWMVVWAEEACKGEKEGGGEGERRGEERLVRGLDWREKGGNENEDRAV